MLTKEVFCGVVDNESLALFLFALNHNVTHKSRLVYVDRDDDDAL
jgi:hypothetical protein